MGRMKDAELHKERGMKCQTGFVLEDCAKACANVEWPGMRTIFAKRFMTTLPPIYTRHCFEGAKNGSPLTHVSMCLENRIEKELTVEYVALFSHVSNGLTKGEGGY
jgi:hypothetical protein